MKLLEWHYGASSGTSGRNYDVSQDGKQFLAIKIPDALATAVPGIVVVQHWDQELLRLVPTK